MVDIKARLEYLRGEIEAERISTAEIIELQGYADQIDRGDVLLLQWAGVPEFPEEDEYDDNGERVLTIDELVDYSKRIRHERNKPNQD